MKARVIERSQNKVTVRLTPNWIARAFGAEERDLNLEWDWYTTGRGDTAYAWICKQSHRLLEELSHNHKINDAITYNPVIAPPSAGDLPKAVVLQPATTTQNIALITIAVTTFWVTNQLLQKIWYQNDNPSAHVSR